MGLRGALAAAAIVAGVVATCAGGAAADATGSLSAATDPAWSRDGSRIAFVNRVGTVGTLYVVNADGSGLRRVTSFEFDAGWPSWSPDGSRIAFAHRERTRSGTTTGIYVVDLDGGGLHRVVSSGVDPAWSPGGKRIAFSDPDYRIVSTSVDGEDKRVVADPGPETGGEGSCKSNGYYEPSWSPDGQLVAFAVAPGEGGECGFDVYIGASRGAGARGWVLASCWCEQPDWSPDGEQLALVRYPPTAALPLKNARGYYTVAIFNIRKRSLVRNLVAGWHPRWSPDGRRLIVVRGNPFASPPDSKIYLVDADGSHLRQLTP